MNRGLTNIGHMVTFLKYTANNEAKIIKEQKNITNINNLILPLFIHFMIIII